MSKWHSNWVHNQINVIRIDSNGFPSPRRCNQMSKWHSYWKNQEIYHLDNVLAFTVKNIQWANISKNSELSECQNDIEYWSMENPVCISILFQRHDKSDKSDSSNKWIDGPDLTKKSWLRMWRETRIRCCFTQTLVAFCPMTKSIWSNLVRMENNWSLGFHLRSGKDYGWLIPVFYSLLFIREKLAKRGRFGRLCQTKIS